MMIERIIFTLVKTTSQTVDKEEGSERQETKNKALDQVKSVKNVNTDFSIFKGQVTC